MRTYAASSVAGCPALEDLRDDQLTIRRMKDERIKPTLRRDSDIARARDLNNRWILLARPCDQSRVGVTRGLASAELRNLIVETAGLYGLDDRQVGRVVDLATQIENRGRAALDRD